jgi:uncharacterized protein YbaP (TraB family)
MLYSNKEYKEVAKQLTFWGDRFEQMKPGFIKDQLILLAGTPKINPKDMMDLSLVDRAVAEQKPVVGLEAVEEQISFVSNYATLQRQAEELLCVCRSLSRVLEAKAKSHEDYLKADLKAMANRYIPCESIERKTLNMQRNKRWLPELSRLMKEKASFIAVGADHLAGKGSLLELLEEEGFVVECAY